MALPPISGIADDGDLPHNNQGFIMIITCVLCLVFATTMVGLRIYTRQFLIKKLWVDDYFAIISVVFLFVLCIVELVSIKYGGLGAHLWDVEAENQLGGYLFYSWLSQLAYNVGLLSVKLMYFFQYYIIVRQNQRLRIIYATIMAIIVIWTVGQTLYGILVCIPVSAIWIPSEPASCTTLSLQERILMSSIGNVITDVIILALPIPVIWGLRLSKVQKWALVGLFSLGFFTCILSCVRIIFTIQPADFTYGGVTIESWSTAEVASGIICGAIPTLRPLVARYVKGFGSQGGTSQAYNQYGTSDSRGPQRLTPGKHTLSMSRDPNPYAEMDDLEMDVQKPYLTYPIDEEKATGGGTVGWNPAAETSTAISQSSSSSDLFKKTHTKKDSRNHIAIRVETHWSVDEQGR
ncbi:hypothetical protein BX600DRAFT_441586 [Xylariales sp. PMI_506]|nr:hypothetical protein BX600DRAFT_441586 [Xylariales sp. PMI_506]